MRIFYSFLALAFTASSCHANLRQELSNADIKAVFPGDPDYHVYSQPYNLRYTKIVEPVAITFPETPEKVGKAVVIGSRYSRSVVSRSGGHNYIANGLGGGHSSVVIDLRNLTSIEFDLTDGLAKVQTGNRLGDVALALNNHSVALPHGTCPYVGVGGHAAYGGFGFTSRAWGLNLDAIESLEVITADGTMVTASATKNSNLFWAMRGAAPSFGITTAITYNTFPAPESATVFEYVWRLSASDAAKAVSDFQLFAKDNIPKEFGPEFVVTKGRTLGEVNLRLFGGWYDEPKGFNKVISPYLAQRSTPHITKIIVGSYIESVAYLGEKVTLNTSAPDTNDTFYVKSLMTPESSPISVKSLEAFMKYAANEGYRSTLDWFVGMEMFGGANSHINSVPLKETSFGKRDALWTFQFYASAPGHKIEYPPEGFSFLDGMVDSIMKDSPPGWKIGAFPNYIDDRLGNYKQLYYGSHYSDLERYKNEYDKNNVFSFPMSIEPKPQNIDLFSYHVLQVQSERSL